jgi:hypothetical protein
LVVLAVLPTDAYWFAHEKTGSYGRTLAIIAPTLAIAALVIFAPAFALIRG